VEIRLVAMSRRKRRFVVDPLAAVAALPWWASALLAVASFVALRRAAAALAAAPDGVVDAGSTLPQQALLIAAQVGQLVLPLLFLFGAAAAIGRLLKGADPLDSYAGYADERAGDVRYDSQIPAAQPGALSWRELEALVSEVYGRQGYVVGETARRADGGVDLILRRGGERYFVQCRHWPGRPVDTDVLRELEGVIAESSAQGGAVVTPGPFTLDALEFGRQAGIELIGSRELQQLARRAVDGGDPPKGR
jgi:restriction system protein